MPSGLPCDAPLFQDRRNDLTRVSFPAARQGRVGRAESVSAQGRPAEQVWRWGSRRGCRSTGRTLTSSCDVARRLVGGVRVPEREPNARARFPFLTGTVCPVRDVKTGRQGDTAGGRT